MSLAKRLRELRDERGMSLDAVAEAAHISKTYLWELERDTDGTKKPSAAVLLQLAGALSTTLADLLALPTVRMDDETVELPPSLREFQARMKTQKTPLSESDLRDLASMKFRGGQPQSADEWNQLYLVMVNVHRKKK